jgi:sugar lactone lactonase YvrE
LPDTEIVAEGLAFPECPRWHEGELWFSDHALGRVCRLREQPEVVLEVPNQPSGLGWRPDGTLLIVSMLDRRLLAWDGGELRQVADFTEHFAWHANDLVVDAAGRAYAGSFGFDLFGGEMKPTVLMRVDPDGTATVAAEDVLFPNGMVITPDGRTLILAETYGNRLTAFAIDAGGELRERREWAPTPNVFPDGICLDAEGCVWAASPVSGEVVRVREGGEVAARVQTSRDHAYACMLGGDDGRTLFVCTATGLRHDQNRAGLGGRIETVRVDVPHAGLP